VGECMCVCVCGGGVSRSELADGWCVCVCGGQRVPKKGLAKRSTSMLCGADVERCGVLADSELMVCVAWWRTACVKNGVGKAQDDHVLYVCVCVYEGRGVRTVHQA
jgi:hypothetical protein